MAETPETPETLHEEVASAAAGGRGDERSEADAQASGDATGAEAAGAPAETAPAATATTRRERLEERRAGRVSALGPRSAEERQAERDERRKRNADERRRYRARTRVKRGEQRQAEPAPVADHAPQHGPGRPRTRQGVVVSDKGEKTITVRIDVVQRHKRYHKIMRSTQKLHAHDERNDAHPGDTVRIVECRPMSRSKRWRLVEIVERAR